MIEFINVSKEYNDKNSAKVFDHINIKLPNKGFVFLSGKSGSGKTTLLNMLSGIDSVSSGCILYNEKDISQIGYLYKNSIIGYIDQHLDVIEDLSVYDNIKLGANAKNCNETKIDEVLKTLRIFHLKKKKCSEISYGERQRVVIARTFLSNAKVIVGDEITSALDNDNAINVLKCLKELSKNCLVVVSSHNYSLVKEYADMVISVENHNVTVDKELSVEETNNDKVKYRRLKFSEKNKISLSFIRNNKKFSFLCLILNFFLLYVIVSLVETLNPNIKEIMWTYNDYLVVEAAKAEYKSIIEEYDGASPIYNVKSEISSIELVSPLNPLKNSIKMIEGNYPSNGEALISKEIANDIISTAYFGENLKYSDLIGKAIPNTYINDAKYKYDLSLTISGIEEIEYYDYGKEYEDYTDVSYYAALPNSIIINDTNSIKDILKENSDYSGSNIVVIEKNSNLSFILKDYEKFDQGWNSYGNINVYGKSFNAELDNFIELFGNSSFYIALTVIAVVIYIFVFYSLCLGILQTNKGSTNLLKKLGYKIIDIVSLLNRFSFIFFIVPCAIAFLIIRFSQNVIMYIFDFNKFENVKNVILFGPKDYGVLAIFVCAMFLITNVIYFITSKRKIYKA